MTLNNPGAEGESMSTVLNPVSKGDHVLPEDGSTDPSWYRKETLRYIIHNPGKHYREIRRRLGISGGTLSRTLEELEMTDQIKCSHNGYFKFFYPAGIEDKGKPLTPMQERVVELIDNRLGSTYQDLAVKLQKTPEAILYHMKNLGTMGVVTSRMENDALRWFIKESEERGERKEREC